MDGLLLSLLLTLHMKRQKPVLLHQNTTEMYTCCSLLIVFTWLTWKFMPFSTNAGLQKQKYKIREIKVKINKGETAAVHDISA